MPITCTSKTEHYTTGKKLLEHYDLNEDGVIERAESIDAGQDYFDDKITKEELDFVVLCYNLKSIDAACEAAGPEKCIQHVKVLDDHNHPISYATVKCNGQTVETDLYGITGFSLDEGKSYTVNASKAGYECHVCKKNFTACTSTISLLLKKKKCSQTIQVKDDKGNVLRQAKVVVDGTTKYTSMFGGPCSFELTSGVEYEAVASKSGYECHDCKKSFTACISTITLILKPTELPPPEKGYLTVNTSPTGASITADGVSCGLTPVTNCELASGSKTVTIAKSGYDTESRTVTITAGETTNLGTITLTPEPTPTEDIVIEDVCIKRSRIYFKICNRGSTTSSKGTAYCYVAGIFFDTKDYRALRAGRCHGYYFSKRYTDTDKEIKVCAFEHKNCMIISETASITFTSSPPNAAVLVDGTRIGDT